LRGDGGEGSSADRDVLFAGQGNDDLNGDGFADEGDVQIIRNNYRTDLNLAGRLTGDVNFDGSVGDLDLYRVWQNFLRTSAQRNPAHDLNRDGQVTEADVDLVRDFYRRQIVIEPIARQSIASAQPLVSRNDSEFNRVPDLRLLTY